MKIFTSYFGRRSFGDLIPISISLWPPRSFVGLQYKKIAPTKDMLLRYKQNGDQYEYKYHYWHDVLKHQNPEQIVAEIAALSGGKDCVLLCYEIPSDFCHRHLFATWMNKCGYDIQEL